MDMPSHRCGVLRLFQYNRPSDCTQQSPRHSGSPTFKYSRPEGCDRHRPEFFRILNPLASIIEHNSAGELVAEHGGKFAHRRECFRTHCGARLDFNGDDIAVPVLQDEIDLAAVMVAVMVDRDAFTAPAPLLGKFGIDERFCKRPERDAVGTQRFRVETSLAFMAGYGVRAFLIAQSLNQVEKAYGEKNSVLDNCHVKVAFATNDERTARRISDMLGAKTEQRHQRNYAGHRLAPWLSHVMVSQQETQRPLLTPGEVMQLPASDALIMLASTRPVRAQKLKYFLDRALLARAGPAAAPPPEPLPLLNAPAPAAYAAPQTDGLAHTLTPEPPMGQAPREASAATDPVEEAPARAGVRGQIARYYMQFDAGEEP